MEFTGKYIRIQVEFPKLNAQSMAKAQELTIEEYVQANHWCEDKVEVLYYSSGVYELICICYTWSHKMKGTALMAISF